MIGGIIQAVVSFELRTDGLTDIQNSRDWCVMRDVFLDGLNSCYLDRFRSIKSGSPRESEITSTPDFFNSDAFLAMAMVADSESLLSS